MSFPSNLVEKSAIKLLVANVCGKCFVLHLSTELRKQVLNKYEYFTKSIEYWYNLYCIIGTVDLVSSYRLLASSYF